MDSTTTTLISTAVAIIVGFLIYRMGCTSSVQPLKSDSGSNKEENTERTKEQVKAKVVEEKKYAGGKLSIFFGSQTGTAEGFARSLAAEGEEHGFEAKMYDLEDFQPEKLQSTEKAIFLMATYGEGEPTDNAAQFIKWLKDEEKENASSCLSKMQFTVFGLGNKQYEHFNRMGKLTNSLLEKHGAFRMFSYGEGDDDGTLEEDFQQWREGLWPALEQKFTSNADKVLSAQDSSPLFRPVSLEYSLRILNPLSSLPPAPRGAPPASKEHFFSSPRATLLSCRELRKGGQKVGAGGLVEGGSTLHIEIDVGRAGLTYHTADNLALLPENPPGLVQRVGEKLGFDLDQLVLFEPVGEVARGEFKPPYPSPCTIKELLSCSVDLQGELKASSLKAFAYYLTDPKERATLSSLLSSAEQRGELKGKLNHKDFSDFLSLYASSLSIPLVDLLHLLPPMQARYYTISSSSLAQPNHCSLTVSLTQHEEGGRIFTGLCSGYLHSLHTRMLNNSENSSPPPSMKIFVRPSSFRLPPSNSTPVIMIGPGTGIAPFRAFCQEREHLLCSASSSNSFGPLLLFFGCRSFQSDFIYQPELLRYLERGILSRLFLAFSRDPHSNRPALPAHPSLSFQNKAYVQHMMQSEEVGKELVQLLQNEGACVYVCGATSMGHDVSLSFQSLLVKHVKSMDASQAAEKVRQWQGEGRYVQELWTA